MIGLTHFLILGAIVFCAGIATILVKRHAIGILMGVELMLNAANINLVAFNHYRDGSNVDGQVMTLFVIVIAAAEAAVALAIFLNFYNNFASIDVDQASEMRG